MREPENYLEWPKRRLQLQLAIVLRELMHAYDQQGFLRSEELTAKRDAWNAIPDASIQMKDRSASYAAIDHTIELLKVEAEIKILVEERNYIQLLINDAR